ncbi:hypothetical protein [Dactylosporangium sp. CA-233914]|uniref:hypothetical protein n=1 Tax=Dactylosporangium sp. CA-233914 TaxID=3239934 RepID=UPI003D8C46C4
MTWPVHRRRPGQADRICDERTGVDAICARVVDIGRYNPATHLPVCARQQKNSGGLYKWGITYDSERRYTQERVARAVSDAAIRASNHALELHDGLDIGADEVGLWVVFLLPGAIWRPDFEGLRVGRWIARTRTVVFEAAVPPGHYDRRGAHAYVQATLAAARDQFHPALSRKRKTGSTAAADGILDGVLERLEAERGTAGRPEW